MSSVLGVLFAALFSLLAIGEMATVEQHGAANTRAAAAAGQLKAITSAAQAYIQANGAAVQAASTPTTPATITVPMLQATQYLSAGISAINPYGQTWVVQVLQPSPGVLQALVLSQGGTPIQVLQAPMIAAMAGAQGGFVPAAGQYGSLGTTVAEGAYGGWQVPLAGYTNPGAGHLAALVAFNEGSLTNDYLYRVAVPGQPALNTMSTTLNMGGNSITAADNVQANTATLGSGPVNGQPGALQIGEAYYYGDSLNSAVRQPGAFWVQHADGSAADAHMDNLTATGSAAISGLTGVAGMSPTAGYPSGWMGGLHSWDVYAEGSIGVGAGGALASYMNNSGNATIGNVLTVNNQIALGTSNGQANPNWGCGPNGSIAARADGSGSLMVCVNGLWSAAGGNVSWYVAPANGAYGVVNPWTGGYSCPGGTNDRGAIQLWYGTYGYTWFHLCTPY